MSNSTNFTPADLLALLKSQGKTLCTAESCTGGLIAKEMTDLPGASSAFVGGVVSYTNEIKMKLLGVSPLLLDEFGAVSAPVAQAMAEGARERLGADIALSVTGVAGPDSDDRGNPVGTIFVGIATVEGTHVRPLHLGADRLENRILATRHAMDLAGRYLSHISYEEI